ncbi:hypothetical protein CHARACLAT_008760 [Characodon lateralis]|uniref:Uncharacterized protein n=1 Tax=Characodon lateralis TaxID=208331 RepID=A0ABU7E891_9TELE|nr:hypothetical protein [Characodon lateralis]
MFLDCGRKPEYPERTHAPMGRTWKLIQREPRLGFKPRTFLLQGNRATNCTTIELNVLGDQLDASLAQPRRRESDTPPSSSSSSTTCVSAASYTHCPWWRAPTLHPDVSCVFMESCILCFIKSSGANNRSLINLTVDGMRNTERYRNPQSSYNIHRESLN